MKFISGKKMSMTQMWLGENAVAVTPVLAGPCTITQVKTKATDKYEAVQLAYGHRQAKNINKPQIGHYKKANVLPAYVKEFRLTDPVAFKIGDVVTVETFAVGDIIDVTGVSKGKGFQGVVKRHGFHGFRKTHGNKDQERMPGSIGPKGPAHVFKGMRMAGRMGGEQVTVTNLEVAAIDAANNILFIKGAVPGAINGFISVRGQGDLQVNSRTASQPETAGKETAEKIAEEVPAVSPVAPSSAEAGTETAVIEPAAVVTEVSK